jgi:hypothetical protein
MLTRKRKRDQESCGGNKKTRAVLPHLSLSSGAVIRRHILVHLCADVATIVCGYAASIEFQLTRSFGEKKLWNPVSLRLSGVEVFVQTSDQHIMVFDVATGGFLRGSPEFSDMYAHCFCVQNEELFLSHADSPVVHALDKTTFLATRDFMPPPNLLELDHEYRDMTILGDAVWLTDFSEGKLMRIYNDFEGVEYFSWQPETCISCKCPRNEHGVCQRLNGITALEDQKVLLLVDWLNDRVCRFDVDSDTITRNYKLPRSVGPNRIVVHGDTMILTTSVDKIIFVDLDSSKILRSVATRRHGKLTPGDLAVTTRNELLVCDLLTDKVLVYQ